MSWYYGTFYCGHEGYVNLNGSAKMRRKMKEYRFSQLCPDCSRSEAIRFRQLKNIRAQKAALQMELPPLTGSARQISWATTLRLEICLRLEQYIELSSHLSSVIEQFERESGAAVDFASDTLPQIFQELLYYLQNMKQSSVYWINNRYVGSRQILLDALPDFLEWRDQEKFFFLQEHFFRSDALLSPVMVRYPGFVVLKSDEKELRAYYEKHSEFQMIMKLHRFHWNGSYWSRNLTEHIGSAADRLAQVGNAFLNSGFRVSIDDPAVREKAINADYEPEHSRWIRRSINGQQFYIELPPDLPSRIRQNLMLIPNASYRYGCVLVDVSRYAELEDFAQMYDFRFDSEAALLLTRYKTLLDNARQVQPVSPDHTQPIDFLRQILETSGTILEDLNDEEDPSCRERPCD